MSESELFIHFALVTSVAFGCGVCGLGLLLFGPKGWIGRGLFAAAGVGTAGGATALLTPQFAGPVFGVGAVLAALLVLASLGAVQRRIGGLLRVATRPRAAGGLVLVAALAGWGLSVWQFDKRMQENHDAVLFPMQDHSHFETVPADVPAVSDLGTPLALTVPAAPLSAAESAVLDANTPAVIARVDRLIRRGPAGDDTNCHGWVFAGGKYNISGRVVPTILNENGYRVVSQPAIGDVCVYTDSQGDVAHTALVRSVFEDGTVLVEGKWGRMGVYLHATTDSCYGPDFAYYRTVRGGHLLHGLRSSAGATSSYHP